MAESDWADLRGELDAWARAGHAAKLWLRDDDAVADTPALRRLLGICQSAGIAPLIAVIPLRAEASLFATLAGSGAQVAVHGIAHANRAGPGGKKQELGLDRPTDVTLAELADGLERLRAMGGEIVLPVLVPPWNRIAPELLAGLAGAGFAGISCRASGGSEAPTVTGLTRADIHVDLVDWRGGRGPKQAERVSKELAATLRAVRYGGAGPIGVLSHHLVFTEQAWRIFEELVTCITAHPGAGWYPFPPLSAIQASPDGCVASGRVEGG